MKDNSLIVIFLGVLTLLAVGVVLSELQSVLLPFIIALFLSNIFKPLVLFLRKKKIPMFLSLLVVLLIIVMLVAGLSMIVSSSAQSFAQEYPKYHAKLEGLLKVTLEQLESLADRIGIKPEDIKFSDAISIGSITSLITAGVGSFITSLGDAFLIFLFLIFILAGSGNLIEKIDDAFDPNHSLRISSIIRNIDDKIRKYLVTKTLVSLGTGTLTTVILTIIGVDFALLWGFLTFLLNFIPNVGSLISTLFPTLIALLQFDSLTQPILVVVLLIVAQNVMGNVVEPRLMAFSLNLSPLLILVGLIFWGWLWGMWGMILAVPIMSIIKIIFENIDPLKPFAHLMSGNITPGK